MLTAITLKTAILQPRLGNHGKVRYAADGYYLNAIGLRNPGIPAGAEHLPATLASTRLPHRNQPLGTAPG